MCLTICLKLSQLSLHHKMLKKVPKVADLRSLCSDLGRDSVYSNEMHSGIVTFLQSTYIHKRNVFFKRAFQLKWKIILHYEFMIDINDLLKEFIFLWHFFFQTLFLQFWQRRLLPERSGIFSSLMAFFHMTERAQITMITTVIW